ncbi:MAG: hypothetical protein H6744_13640 [Deltaproteobacteria bacterium]|nr:hypothetical protein [Deltaproteobacteria bacterium]
MNARLIALLLLAAPGLVGFSSASTFDVEAMRGGGDRRPFTGSPTTHGLSCTTCHEGDRVAELQVSSLPAHLLEDGVFQPGRTYLINVTLPNETRGLERSGGCTEGLAGCNRNLFTAEFLDASRAPAGLLCPSDLTDLDGACPSTAANGTALIADGGAIAGQSLAFPLTCDAPGAVAGRCVDLAGLAAAGKSEAEIAAVIRAAVRGSTSWQFAWRAPLSVGSVTLWVGAVDGDGGNSIDPAYADYAGDAVGLYHRTLVNGSLAANPPARTRSGSLAGGGGWTAAFLMALSILVATAVTRRRP